MKNDFNRPPTMRPLNIIIRKPYGRYEPNFRWLLLLFIIILHTDVIKMRNVSREINSERCDI